MQLTKQQKQLDEIIAQKFIKFLEEYEIECEDEATAIFEQIVGKTLENNKTADD